MKEIANAHVTATVYHSLLDLEKSSAEDKADESETKEEPKEEAPAVEEGEAAAAE